MESVDIHPADFPARYSALENCREQVVAGLVGHAIVTGHSVASHFKWEAIRVCSQRKRTRGARVLPLLSLHYLHQSAIQTEIDTTLSLPTIDGNTSDRTAQRWDTLLQRISIWSAPLTMQW